MRESVPTAITSGRKRRLLRSLASRHRNDRLLFGRSLSRQGSNFGSEGSQCNLSGHDKRHAPTSDTIYDMASALLSDTEISIEEGLSSPGFNEVLPGKDVCSVSISQVGARRMSSHHRSGPQSLSLMEEQIRATLQAHSLVASPNHPEPMDAGQLKRSASARPSKAKKDIVGAKRRAPPLKMATIGLSMAQGQTGLPASASVPLPSREAATPGTTERPKATPLDIEEATPDEVQHKVYAMLAATDALKPAPDTGVSPDTSLARTTKSKVLAKVSNAWVWLNAKSPLADHKQRGVNNCDRLQPLQPSISNIEIRLNEGDNLNRKKVQNLVGGKVTRKPVADDGKSLRSGRSLDEPPSSQDRSEGKSRASEKEADHGDHYDTPVSPFDSESGFDSDLEDRILRSSPIASSTPRAGHSRRNSYESITTPPTSPTRGRPKSLIDLSRPQLMDSGIPLGIHAPTGFRELLGSAARRKKAPDRSGSGLAGTNSFRNAPLRRQVAKKHPSPSKEALETLEAALRSYDDHRDKAPGEDIDELADDPKPAAPLQPRDRNQVMNRQGAHSNANRNTSINDVKSGSTAAADAGSKIPRRVEKAGNLRASVRLAPAFRPAAPRADETDELH